MALPEELSSSIEYGYEKLTIPYDSEGYAKSFTLDQVQYYICW